MAVRWEHKNRLTPKDYSNTRFAALWSAAVLAVSAGAIYTGTKIIVGLIMDRVPLGYTLCLGALWVVAFYLALKVLFLGDD